MWKSLSLIYKWQKQQLLFSSGGAWHKEGNRPDASKEIHSPKPSAIPTSCGQALEHSTAPSQDSTVVALPHKGIPAGKSSQDTAVRVAQHFLPLSTGVRPSTSPQILGKAASSMLGWAGSEAPRLPVGSQAAAGRMPGLAILTVCLNDSGSFLSFPVPRNDSAIFCSLSHWVWGQKQEVKAGYATQRVENINTDGSEWANLLIQGSSSHEKFSGTPYKLPVVPQRDHKQGTGDLFLQNPELHKLALPS